MLREQGGGEQRAGDATLHVADAAAVELAVLQHATERRHRPRKVLEDREGVEMTVEDQPPPRAAALQPADQALHMWRTRRPRPPCRGSRAAAPRPPGRSLRCRSAGWA